MFYKSDNFPMQSRFLNKNENKFAAQLRPQKFVANRQPLASIKNAERDREIRQYSASSFTRRSEIKNSEDAPEKMFLPNPELPYEAVEFEFEKENSLIKDEMELEPMPNIQPIRW